MAYEQFNFRWEHCTVIIFCISNVLDFALVRHIFHNIFVERHLRQKIYLFKKIILRYGVQTKSRGRRPESPIYLIEI